MPCRLVEGRLPWISPPFKPTPIHGYMPYRPIEGLSLWIGVKPCVGVEETEEWMWCRTKHCRAFYEGVPPRVVVSNRHRGRHHALEGLL